MDKNIELIKEKITLIKAVKPRLIIAIDGRCASGKTTLAKTLGSELSCNVFHMDDFFLRPEQRTAERFAEPGGNVDRERFYSEVLSKIIAGGDFEFRPFDCKTLSLGTPVSVKDNAVSIVEGAYSCHPGLWDNYDLRIFLTTSRENQLERIKQRNGEEMLEVFKSKWIPLEEKYFAEFDFEKRCDICIET